MKRKLHMLIAILPALLLCLTLGAGCTGSKDDPVIPKPQTPTPNKPDNPTPDNPDNPDDPDDPNNNGGNDNPGTAKGPDASIDEWMFNYMNTHYLWNRAVQNVTPNYALDYEEFLLDVLERVAAQNDVNHDDGHWSDGKRTSFYSNVTRYKAGQTSSVQTRFDLNTYISSYGFEMIYYMQLTNRSYGFLIADLNPEGPAYKAGIRRGDVIMKIDGTTVTATNIDKLWMRLFYEESGSMKITLADIDALFEGQAKEDKTIPVSTARFKDNPVLISKVLTSDKGKKVGYLDYATFNYNYDQELIDAFGKFATEGIEELVLDLRYNGGGHVVSSTVLGTLVAGEAHKGEIYCKTSYNEDRKEESVDIYKIGTASYNSSAPSYRYNPIATALQSAVNLNRIYVLCGESTASASELVINGLRGLDIEVRLIGEQTNGKNVGMEPIVKTFGDYEYDFSPITFYSVNAKDFNDYSEGFVPDIVDGEYFYYTKNDATVRGELGNPELDWYLMLAMAWIDNGSKPSIAAGTRTGMAAGLRLLPGEVKARGTNPRRPQGMLALPRTLEE